MRVEPNIWISLVCFSVLSGCSTTPRREASPVWPPLAEALESNHQVTNKLSQPIEMVLNPKHQEEWVGSATERKVVIRSVNRDRWGDGSRVRLDGEGDSFWFEAVYKKSLPPVEKVLQARSASALEKLFGKHTNMAGGYDGGGSHIKYYYFTVTPHRRLDLMLVEIETSGVVKGQLRVWLGSHSLDASGSLSN